jgi:hypothetical protein
MRRAVKLVALTRKFFDGMKFGNLIRRQAFFYLIQSAGKRILKDFARE